MTFGIVVWLLGQMIINVGMVLALLPVIGIPLPLVSYGGSALVPSLVALGLLIGFARREPEAARALAQRKKARSAGLSAGRVLVTRVGRAMRVLLAGGGTAGHTSPLLATADAPCAAPTRTSRSPASARREGLETQRGPRRRATRSSWCPPVPLPRTPSADLLRVPGRLRAARQGGARGLRPGPARRGRRLRRLRLGAGLPRRPARAGCPLVVHEGNALPGIANKLGARFTAARRDQLPRHPAAPRPSTSGCRSAG